MSLYITTFVKLKEQKEEALESPIHKTIKESVEDARNDALNDSYMNEGLYTYELVLVKHSKIFKDKTNG